MATGTPTTSRAKKAAPKVPQDRKPKVEETIDRPEDTPGWNLMKDFNEVPVWDQTPLIDMLKSAFDTSEDEDAPTDEEIDAMTDEEFEAFDKKRKRAAVKSFDMNIVGELAKALIPFAEDEAAYTKFVSGSGAMERAMNLAMAWVGQMGESESSAT